MKTILLTLTILVASSLSANWEVTDREVSTVTTMQKTASITNDIGDTLSIYRAADRNIWCSFKVFNSKAFVPYWVKAPILVIDDNKSIDLASTQTMQSSFSFHSYDWTKDQLNFRISPSKTDQLISDTLFELMRGDKLTVQYTLRTGVKMNSTFSLKEANIAIGELLEINPYMDEAAHAVQKRFYFAVVDEIARSPRTSNVSQRKKYSKMLDNCADLNYPNVEQYKICAEAGKK